MVRGKTIKLFFMDGDASGRVKCSIANWTGVAYKIPKTMLDECQDMKALKQSGVYFLFGTDSDEQPVVMLDRRGVVKMVKDCGCALRRNMRQLIIGQKQ